MTKLRRLAAWRLAHDLPGQALAATALVHEAYIRLVEGSRDRKRYNHRHFFAAEAMRPTIIERARQRQSLKRARVYTSEVSV